MVLSLTAVTTTVIWPRRNTFALMLRPLCGTIRLPRTGKIHFSCCNSVFKFWKYHVDLLHVFNSQTEYQSGCRATAKLCINPFIWSKAGIFHSRKISQCRYFNWCLISSVDGWFQIDSTLFLQFFIALSLTQILPNWSRWLADSVLHCSCVALCIFGLLA